MESKKDISGTLLTNYIRLQYLLNTTSTAALRETFRENWKACNQSEWEDSSDNRTAFTQSLGNTLYKNKNLGSIQKNLLKSGEIGKWDLPLLIDSLECLDKEPRPELQRLRKFRNEIAHQGSMAIENEKFEEMWGSISSVLISYGVSQEELDETKKLQLGEDQQPKKESHLNEANMGKAEELKTEGNQLFQNKKYKEAIDVYSEAILLSGIPSNHLAVLYSNRSIAYLKSGDAKTAKDDAKGAVHLRPSWWRAYHRLACAYDRLEKFDPALKYYEVAHGLESSNVQLKDDLASCKYRMTKRREAEHMDPMNLVQSFEDMALQTNTEYGTSINANVLRKLQKEVGGLDGICEDGDNYRFGRGVKQDYAAAARYYTKAARAGSARGIYSLALLKVEGQGVTRNVAEAIRLLKEAASQEPTVKSETYGINLPNLGVAEAEHALGHSHEEGVYVEMDMKQALYWYERATKHGSGDAANNVGLLYAKGKGVPQSTAKAIQYYKLSAYMKVVRAMESLAHLYLKLEDVVNAQKWHAFAIVKGSASLGLEFREKFGEKIGDSLNKPLDIDTFQRQLNDEVENGPLKHMISEYSHQNVIEQMLAGNRLKSVNTGRNATSRKLHGLTDPYRVLIINKHRSDINFMNSGQPKPIYNIIPASLKQKSDVDLTALKPIFFEGMKADKDQIYDGKVIKLRSIEDAVLGTPSVGIIAEDQNGDVQRVFIYNFKQDKETQNTLGFGCTFSILNPYFRLTDDGLPAIRVDDTSLLWLHKNLKETSLCRYCGKGNSTLTCRKCMRAVYCSKECQKNDANLLKHDLMCKKTFWYPRN